MEASLEILYVDIRAYNKKLGFLSAVRMLMRHYLVLLFHFYLALQPIKVVIDILLLKTRILIYISGKTQ